MKILSCSYLWWVPLTVLYYFIYTWLSKQNNVCGGKWLIIMFLFGAFAPMWLIVSRISKNLLFDGMLFDNIMFLTYVFAMIYLDSAKNLSSYQWFGLTLIVLGSVIMRST